MWGSRPRPKRAAGGLHGHASRMDDLKMAVR